MVSEETLAVQGRERDVMGGVLALVLVALGLLAFRGSFGGPFVYDDLGSIVRNPSLRELGDIGRVLTPPADETVAGRPVLNLSFAIDYARNGLQPRGFHFTNLAIHLASALLLFALARRTLARPRMPLGLRRAASFLAFAIAALWSLHPLQTESVVYIVQRAESLAGLFYLGTLYAAARAFDAQRPGAWVTVAAACCLLGMGTKEVMFSAPIVVLLYDRAFVSASFREALGRHRRLYILLAASWLLLAVLVAGTPRSGSVGFGFEQLSGVDYLLTQSGVILHYLRLSFWPWPLVFHYDWPIARAVSDVILPLITVVALAVTSLLLYRKWPAIGFCALAFFLLLGPTSSFLPILTEVAAEHRMYLPLACVLALVVVGAFRALERLAGDDVARRRTSDRIGIGMLLVLLVGAAWATGERNRDYESVVKLWSSVVEAQPTNGMAHDSLGLALRIEGRLHDARLHGEEAVRLEPNAPDFRLNLATSLLDLKLPEEAEGHLRVALERRAEDPLLHNALGVALAQSGKPDEARAAFERALALDADVPGARANLDALNGVGRPPAAVAGDPEHRARVRAALEAGRGDEAIALLRARLRTDYDRDSAMTLARLLATHPDGGLRDGPEAVTLAERLERESRAADPIVLDTLAAAYAECGRFNEALGAARRALEAPFPPEIAPLAEGIRQRIVLYERGRPFHLP